MCAGDGVHMRQIDSTSGGGDEGEDNSTIGWKLWCGAADSNNSNNGDNSNNYNSHKNHK